MRKPFHSYQASFFNGGGGVLADATKAKRVTWAGKLLLLLLLLLLDPFSTVVVRELLLALEGRLLGSI